MPNQLAEDVKKATAPTPPTDDAIKAELERERQARAFAEQQATFYRGAAASEWDRAEKARRSAGAPVPTGTITDPFAKFAAEDPLLDPEKRARLLDEGARTRAREEAMKLMQEQEARRQWERQQDRAQGAMESFTQAHPEVVADSERFAGAAMQAKVRADNQRLDLSPSAMLNLAYQIYNEGKASPPSAPYTEGASGQGAIGAKKVEEEVPVSMATELYGAEPKDFMDERKVPLDKYTEAFLDQKNLDLVEKEKFWSGLRNVVGDIRGAQSRKTAAGR